MEKIILSIQKVMKDQRITEQMLANETGLPQSTLHRIVSGQNKKLDLSKIRIIQKALNITETEQPTTIAEQIGEGYAPEVKLMADYLEVKIKGKTAEERLKIVEEIMAEIRSKYK